MADADAAPCERYPDDLPVARRTSVRRDCGRRRRGCLARRVGLTPPWRITLIALLLGLTLAAGSVSGVVKDSTGAVVTGASVIVKPASGPERAALTGTDGKFNVDTPAEGDVTVIVRAGGFAEKTQRVGNDDRGHEIEIVLQPATLLETVTVT